jgi:hypothetical protein
MKLTWQFLALSENMDLEKFETNQCERTDNDDLPLLPVQPLTEMCIFQRPHAPMLPEHKPHSMGC